jgi:hypothetical protein
LLLLVQEPIYKVRNGIGDDDVDNDNRRSESERQGDDVEMLPIHCDVVLDGERLNEPAIVLPEAPDGHERHRNQREDSDEQQSWQQLERFRPTSDELRDRRPRPGVTH